MRHTGRYALGAFFVCLLLRSLPLLMDKPEDGAQAAPITPVETYALRSLPSQEPPSCAQPTPPRWDSGPRMVLTGTSGLEPVKVRTDANGHPLGGMVYIRAVYSAFRLEERSG